MEEKALKTQNDLDEFVLVNIYERIVMDSVMEMISFMDDMCSCPKCVSDACALVLNQMTPCYVTTRKGQLLSKLPQMKMENQIDISVMVVKALRLVKESPRH